MLDWGKREKAAEQLEIMQKIRGIERDFVQLHQTASENPNYADVRYQIGMLARQLNKPELACLWFRAALALQPRHTLALTELRKYEARQIHP